jgi:putative ABC transport system permease protein
MRTSGMALRNLGRQKKRTFLLGGAIAFGLLIVTLLNGFAGSFIENVGENFSHLFAGHIFIDGVEKLPSGRMVSRIRNDEIITNAIEAIGIPYRYLTKQSEFSGTLIFEGESVRQNVRGIEWDKESFFKERLILAEGSFDGMADPRGIIVSAKIAEKLDVRIGDRMLVQLTTATGQQNVGEFVLAATILDPGMMGSISAYADLDYVNELLNLAEGEYMTLGIFLEDMVMIESEGNRLYEYMKGKVDLFDRDSTETEENPFLVIMNQVKEEQWEGTRYRFYTLNDMLEEVKEIVQVLNVASLIFLVILFVVIMVGVTNTFRMVMFERIKEIGTMRALGMQRTEVRRLFLAEAFYLALGGVAAGMVASGIVMFVLSRINWGTDTPIFILLKNGYMTFKLLPWQVLLNTAVIILMTLFAAFSPARKAALLEPADALRTIK